MRIFKCPNCSVSVVFQNLFCIGCGTNLYWDPAAQAFIANVMPCSNRDAIACNWPATGNDGGFCFACEMTDVIPDTFHEDNLMLWAEAESSKRRALATLGRWGWFTPNDPGPLPAFHMLSEEDRYGERNVVMAHNRGLITINVTEANLVERVERGLALGEKLRTMVGHFRHEMAHFLFERLRPVPGFLSGFRDLMGDENADYGAALKAYYRDGPPADWNLRFITEYASAHPHEDWAESVTHLLHLTDITDSAVAVGWRSPMLSDLTYDAYADADTERLLEYGTYFSMATNHINRAVGVHDLYPFVLTPGIKDKLAFVHGWIRAVPQPPA